MKEEMIRAEKATYWNERLKSLRYRKENPLKESEFCDKYGISRANFNRNKKGHTIPTPETFLKVERAFNAEGV